STFVDGLDEEELALTLYPNPVKDLLHIQTDHSINKLLVYNTNGQLVISKEDAFEKINVSQLAKGLYLMQVYTEEGEIIQKKFLKE
ncbi:MAG: T9SS type A sorting domain-containing protein, partial [Bacteroidota bacterium]